jgi:hypothetical protein
LELLAASFAVLFQELALIRWLPVEVRVVAYFPNLILIAAFLGLGVGALRARGPGLGWLWAPSLLVVAAVAWGMGQVAFTANDVSEHLWLLYADLGEDALVIEGIHAPLVLLFCLTAVTFAPLGQVIGERLDDFRARSSALTGYALDLGGSLLGVIAFTAVSWAGLRPVVWFIPPLALGLFFVSTRRRIKVAHAACAAGALAVIVATTGSERFSPYYALEAVPVVGLPAVDIRANGSLHQVAIDLAQPPADVPWLATGQAYRHPYREMGRPIRKALVLGAGTGNDIAVLLDQGALEVHAVEIDPVILELGRQLHPDRPYDDPRVTVHNTDARSFLNETDETFDVITFGTLDSMTRLSALSNVRLDNFVYTREALAAARDHLTLDGGLVLYFMVGDPFLDNHLVALLASTFGTLPQIHRGDYSIFNTVFMAGPAFAASDPGPDPDAWFLQEDLVANLTPSDDWPYLYLRAAA